MVNKNKNKEQYYKNENIKERQNFTLEISNTVVEHSEIDIISSKNDSDIEEYNNRKENPERDNTQNNEQSAEEERNQRKKSGAEQVKGYDKNVLNNQNETSPSNLEDPQKYKNKYIREKTEKRQNILNDSQKLSKRTREKSSNSTTINYKIGEEETKDFFRKKDQYLGQCQICGFTFTSKNSVNYCERFTWSDYTRIKVKADLIDAGNSLCLCARCHSIIKGGGDFEAIFLTEEVYQMLDICKDEYDFDNFIDDIDSDKLLSTPECFKEHIEFNDMYFVDIRLNNNNERIYFTEEHLLMFFVFLKS